MFHIGDKIVYPMHGAGIIEAIEEREILGRKQTYYVLQMPIGDLKVMIPTHNVDDIGIREIINQGEADKVLAMMAMHAPDVITNWNKRYRDNMVKIKSGNIYEVAEVVKSLMTREKEKGLSTGERKMLCSAKQILVSELVLAKDMRPLDIEQLLECCV